MVSTKHTATLYPDFYSRIFRAMKFVTRDDRTHFVANAGENRARESYDVFEKTPGYKTKSN